MCTSTRIGYSFSGMSWQLGALIFMTAWAPAQEEGDALLDDDDLLEVPEDSTHGPGESLPPAAAIEAARAHEKLFAAERFPSASVCRTCHAGHYREWSVSQHAYALISPVFNSMQGTILKRTGGTNGDFCIRCHTPVGMSLGEPAFTSALERDPVSREGVTCVTCHRMNRAYGKVSGRISLLEGDILTPVYGPTGNEGLQQVLSQPAKYKVVTSPDKQGRRIHRDAVRFFQLPEPGFCGTCHDVTLVDGFRLEEAFSSYKHSPAAKEGVTCQDCHMGKEPGVPSGYRQEPAAVIGGVPARTRKRTNHMFVGPDYSVVHPGLFPHNTRAEALAPLEDWLSFDVEAGWGTEKFEDHVSATKAFPAAWASIDDRFEAREIVEENLALLKEASGARRKLLQAGYLLGDIVLQEATVSGVRFEVEVRNETTGHAVPTGFDADRLVWLDVSVTDHEGRVVMRSGDLDPNGDVRDQHALYVHSGELPADPQLFSLQSKFLTRMVRGGEREQVLAVNYSPDPLPFVRPETRSSVLLGRPRGARKHRKSIAAGDGRRARYRVEPEALTGSGPYHVRVKLMAAMVPVHLVAEISEVGFDLRMSPRDVADAVVDGHLVIWERRAVFELPAAPR